jgi:hypothetical protein
MSFLALSFFESFTRIFGIFTVADIDRSSVFANFDDMGWNSFQLPGG